MRSLPYSLPRSQASRPSRPAGGTADRAIGLLLSLMLLMPLPELPAQSRMDQADAREALLLLSSRQPKRKNAAVVGEWVLYPAGFGFRIPEGMERSTPRRGETASLVDATKAKVAYRANISLTIADEDKHLTTKTQKDVEGVAKASGIARFELLSLKHELFLGEPSLSLLYYTGSAPKLVVSQRMFNRDGKCYVLTLSAECSLGELQTALVQFDAFCDSFFFAEP